MDSQVPNKVVREWIEEGRLFQDVRLVRPETTYMEIPDLICMWKPGIERYFVEVEGGNAGGGGCMPFPPPPPPPPMPRANRAVKHLEELIRAVKDGYDAYVFFVIQMKGVRYFTPNTDTHPAFAETLKKSPRQQE